MSKKVFQMKILIGGGGGIKPPKKNKTTKIITTQPILAQWSCLKCCCAPQ